MSLLVGLGAGVGGIGGVGCDGDGLEAGILGLARVAGG